ncbi:MAG: hypothetical protein AAGI13_01460 [Pseudomonadota bacterium]
MTDHILEGAVSALASELESELAYLTDLKSELAQNEARRTTLMAGLRGAYMALPIEARRSWRDRVYELTDTQRERCGKQARDGGKRDAILGYLADNAGKIVKVSDVGRALQDAGYTQINRAYPSFALTQMMKERIVRKIRTGLYQVNALHTEILYRE